MTERPLRWGLISTARINRALIPAIRASARSELVAVASRDQARAESYAAEWDIPRAYGSREALLTDPEIDVIYNALPNDLHYEGTIQAADAGKHVLCEKPLALTVDEVDGMIAAAQRNQIAIFEGFMYRYHPQTRRLQELVRERAIGELRLIRASFSFNLQRVGDVRLSPEHGGGSLWDVGCYPVSFARAVVGEEPVELFGWHRLGESEVDLAFNGQMRFARGVVAQFDCSFDSPLRYGAEIIGTEGRLLLDNPWKPGADGPPSIRLVRADGRQEEIAIEQGEKSAYLAEVEAVEATILDGAAPVVSLEDSRNNVATLLALYESAWAGRPVTLGG